MKIKDIMTKDVLTVSVGDAIDYVAKVMIDNRIHGVPVMDGVKLVGIITETDFFIKDSFSFHLPSYLEFIKKTKFSGKISDEEKKQIEELINSTAKDIMTEPCITVFADDELNKLLTIFKETSLNTVPVVDLAGNVQGIITRSDIIKTIKL